MNNVVSPIEIPPTLNIDQWFANRRAGVGGFYTGHRAIVPALEPVKLNAHQFGERLVLWNLLKHLERAGFVVNRVYDSEEMVGMAKEADPHFATMELVFNLDEASVRFIPAADKALSAKERASREHGVYIVRGNSPEELVSDYSFSEGDEDGFGAAMGAFDAERYCSTQAIVEALWAQREHSADMEVAHANEKTRADRLEAALRRLVERCDGAEGVLADGSNIDTIDAHAALGDLPASAGDPPGSIAQVAS